MEDFDEIYDFVVVGSGGGSMCAALLLKSLGKDTIILEKTDLIGGSTAMAGGVMWIPNNRFMQPDGVGDNYDKALAYLQALGGDRDGAVGASRSRRQAYLSDAPKMIDFLVEQGVKLRRIKSWPDYYDDLPGGSVEGRTVIAELFDANTLGPWKAKLRPNFLQIPAALDEMLQMPNFRRNWAGKKAVATMILRSVGQKLMGKHWVTAGNALQGRMLKAAIDAGISVRTDHAVGKLIADDNGRIVGVVASHGGRDVRIGGRAGVLINAGGFARNQAMRDRYQPGTRVEWTNAAPGDTGEMIEEAMRHGAAIAQMDEMVGCQITLTPETPDIHAMIQGDCSKPHSMIVDRTGVRYMREAQSYMSFCQDMLARDKIAPAAPSWIIVDSLFFKNYMMAGSMPGSKKPKAWYDSGFLKKADTLQDLAAQCNMPVQTFIDSVARFNVFAKNGKDEDFNRGERAYDNWLGDADHLPSASLGTIEQSPFYAYHVYPGDVGTFGGVVTDEHARVLRDDGTPIAGLYATGTSSASVMGRAYSGAGSSIGPSFTFGYIAAKHAAHADNVAS